MTRCKFIHFVFHVLPIRALQNFLIKRHFEKCPDCVGELVDLEEVQGLFVREDTSDQSIDIWPAIQAGLCEVKEKKEAPRFLLRWKWALGAAGLSLFLLVGYWAVNQSNDADLAPLSMMDNQVQINFIRIEEKPAGAYVYKPQDSEMIFVWAERTP